MKKLIINGGIFMLSLILPAIVECRKNSISPKALTADAVIIDAGPVAADGCGWLIKIGAATYHPKTLGSKYQVNNLKVNVTYELLTDKFQCGIAASSPANPGISIIQIDKIAITN